MTESSSITPEEYEELLMDYGATVLSGITQIEKDLSLREGTTQVTMGSFTYDVTIRRHLIPYDIDAPNHTMKPLPSPLEQYQIMSEAYDRVIRKISD